MAAIHIYLSRETKCTYLNYWLCRLAYRTTGTVTNTTIAKMLFAYGFADKDSVLYALARSLHQGVLPPPF